MIRPQGRAKALYILFLSYFVVYAMSPLCFTYTEENSPRDIGASASPLPARNTLRIFMLDLVLSGLSQQNDVPQEGVPGVTVLMRKLRAVISKNKVVTLITIDTIGAARLPNIFGLFSPAAFFCSFQKSRGTPEGYSPSYSGLSPPSVFFVKIFS